LRILEFEMKVRDVIKEVELDGWNWHHAWQSPSIPPPIEIGHGNSGHPSEDLDPKTQRSMLKQAGLR
jgi:predicted RNA binding protein YcfA (HicA-like mRNA interferase family)